VSAGVLPESVLPSLGLQARYVGRAVERDIGGNHVLINAIAMCAAGKCLADDTLLRRGRSLLERELTRQILPDGGHEERSTSYHRELLELLEDLEIVLGEKLPRVAEMRSWAVALAGPDGRLPLLNDAWEGPPLTLPATRPSIDERTGTGHVILRDGSDLAVLDVGDLCPRHLPAHAHADALSFSLWLGGEPVVLDPGAGTYSGDQRDELRGTRAHATVEVDGEDQCVFWAPFRASYLPVVERGPIDIYGDVVVLHAWHNGYERLADPVVHHRLFCWMPGTGLAVVDTLVADGEHQVVTSLPLANGAGDRGHSVLTLGDGPQPAIVPRLAGPYLGTIRSGEAWERCMRVASGRPFGWAVVRTPATVRIVQTELVVDRPGAASLTIPLPAAMLS
jgi:hypothetical protein